MLSTALLINYLHKTRMSFLYDLLRKKYIKRKNLYQLLSIMIYFYYHLLFSAITGVAALL